MSKYLLVALLLLSSNLEAVITKNLLITGCGRSGTTYISRVLEKCHVHVPHEELGVDGTVSWFCTYRGLSLDYNLGAEVRFTHTFHQVRNPLDTISSVYWSFDSDSWAFIEQNLHQITPRDSLLAKSAKYWYYWNLRADAISEWTYRIEDIDNVWQQFCKRLKIPFNPHVLNQVPRNTNTWSKVQHRFTWRELQNELDDELFEDLQMLAHKYGYPIKD